MRKPRVWAATPDAIPLLGRGAKRLAIRSAAQLTTPAVAKGMQRLRQLLRAERLCKLGQGDVLVRLIDRHHLRAIDVARQTKQRPNDLSQMYRTCRMFPPRARRRGVPYNVYFMAMRMVRKFKHLQLQPADVLNEIAARGFTQHRDVTAHFAARARATEHRVAAEKGVMALIPHQRAYHCRFQSLLNRFDDRSIALIHVDPPYRYPNRPDGRYAGGSARSKNCDNAGGDDATALVVDLLSGGWQSKLKPGGVLLLWQASGPLTDSVHTAIQSHNWAIEHTVVWDKGRCQAGDFASPYARQSEWMWVLKRGCDRLLNHDGSARGDIIRFRPASAPTLASQQQHAFEKPIELCKFLVSKHTYEGELIFDCCGCTGSMSAAAVDLNRRWIYAESNAGNYQLGVARISRHLNRLQSVAG